MKISVKPQVYVFFVALLLLVPLPWLSAWLVAIVFHELCHICAVYLSGGKIFRLKIGENGICMDSTPLTEGKRLFCILCGPLGGLLPVLLSQWLPRIAICCWVLSIYNLLPFLPLDGGRALHILIKKQEHFLLCEKICLGLFTALALYGTFFLHLGPLPVVVVVLFWIRNRKFPCK